MSRDKLDTGVEILVGIAAVVTIYTGLKWLKKKKHIGPPPPPNIVSGIYDKAILAGIKEYEYYEL